MSAEIIVAAVDLSTASASVFEAALELAQEKPTAEIHLLHVLRSGREAKATGAAEALAEWADRLPERGARIELHGIEASNVAEAIVQFAAKVNADVVLLGTHGRTGVSRMILGSVAEVVVRTAGCSVYVIRNKSHRAAKGP